MKNKLNYLKIDNKTKEIFAEYLKYHGTVVYDEKLGVYRVRKDVA